MNQADVTKLISKLRIAIQPRRRKLRSMGGPAFRLEKISRTVTALIKYERIELYYPRADESRGYAERLISDAIRYGDTHAATMEMANFYIKEKQYIHKLFKVLVPRFQNCPVSYTRMYKAPRQYPEQAYYSRAVLELRGNPFPALKPSLGVNRNFIHNVLLDEAKKEYRRKKYEQLAGESNNQEQLSSDKIDEIVSKLEKTAIVDDSSKVNEEKPPTDATDDKK